jgi:uncharacterized protein (DUF302 family)
MKSQDFGKMRKQANCGSCRARANAEFRYVASDRSEPLRPMRRNHSTLGIPMSFKKRALASLALLLSICAGLATAHAADDGLITKPSKYSVKETVTRFEAAVKQKEAAGFIVFTEIDHAAAAKKFGLDMRPRRVIVFGSPKLGTPAMVKTPLLAIDVPPKALVWEDDQGKVWLSYNSSDYVYNTIYRRHGAAVPSATARFAKLLDEMSDQATK